jgi:hypothetical protein
LPRFDKSEEMDTIAQVSSMVNREELNID